MALSASKDYSITRANIIEGALLTLGVYDQGEAISGEETSAADRRLNLMVKEWTARGADIWLRDEVTIFLQPNTQSYALGTAHATTSYVETTLSTLASASNTSLTVGSTTGMTGKTDTFVDGDVATATNRITMTAHPFSNSDACVLTTTGTLPSGLALATTYYSKVVDANTIELYSDPALSTIVNIYSAAAGGTHTIAAGDNIGIKLNDDTIHWDTIVSVDSSTTLTISSGLASAAASGNKVYAYTTKAGRPTKIVYAYRRDVNGYDTEVSLIGEVEYRGQSSKAAEGPPIEAWYQPTMTTGTLYVWPVDGGSTWDKLIIIGQYYPDDFDSASDNPQFPIEWGNTLTWGLAAELASSYGLPEREQGRLWQVAEHKLNELLDYDVENASVIFTVNSER